MGFFTRSRLLLFLKGMAMGAADSVPGVSGGTIAFISNIYDELLASIHSVNIATIKLLFKSGPGAAWQAINGNFLLTLGAGILLSLLLSANLVVYLLATHYSYLMCFFTGLILASLWYVGRQIKGFNIPKVLLGLLGMAAAIAIAMLPQLSGSTSLGYFFFSGALAICAMILPGISGAFILLLLGAYEPVLHALTTFQWPVIVVFAAGCGTGLLSFSRVLYWLLSHQRNATLAALLGVLAGSLYSLWPWRAPVIEDSQASAHAFVHYVNGPLQGIDAISGQSINLLLAAVLLLTGAMLVLLLEQIGSKSRGKSSSSES